MFHRLFPTAVLFTWHLRPTSDRRPREQLVCQFLSAAELLSAKRHARNCKQQATAGCVHLRDNLSSREQGGSQDLKLRLDDLFHCGIRDDFRIFQQAVRLTGRPTSLYAAQEAPRHTRPVTGP
jgi:hypothetical protein